MVQFKVSVVLYFFATVLSVAKSQSTNPIVSTEYGKIEGFRHTTPSGFETEVFLGVPYAAPPIGDLRFEKPIPPTPWTITRQAKSYGAPCVTAPKYSPATASEDCLFMNIIKPTAPSSDPKGYPVMLWIHGGGYLAGSSADYPINGTAERIVSKGVIYVSINYRQAAFGFFSTADSKAPGNYGMWDQIQALKFIQKVIKKFGGNPDNVTPFGQSAGGISVSLLTLTQKTKNLFKQAIDMSGSSNYRMELMRKDVNYSLQLADNLGCGCSSNPKVCLKTKSTAEIQSGMSFIQYLLQGDTTIFNGFIPRVDGDLFPNVKYEKLVKQAPKRNILMGANSQEFYVFALVSSFSNPSAKYFPITAAKAANFSQQDFADIVNNVFATQAVFGNKHEEAGNKIIAFYNNQTHYDPSRNFYLQIYAQLISDLLYNVREMREAKWRAAAGQNVYFYVYNYVPPSMTNALFEGAGHSRELHNLFGQVFGLPIVPLVGDAAAVQQTFSNLLINFAKTGIPSSGTLQVPKITGNTLDNIQINPVSSIQQDFWRDRIDFWDYIAETYGYDWPELRYV